MICLDTNVLLRWLLEDDADQWQLADAVISSCSSEQPGFVAEVTMAELVWVLRSVYRYPKERVLDVVEDLLSSSDLEFDDGESIWQALLHARHGADFSDALIVETARLNGCQETVTFDRKAAGTLGMRLLS